MSQKLRVWVLPGWLDVRARPFRPIILLMKEDLKLALESLGYADTDVSKWIKNDELIKIKNISEAIKIILQKIQK